jgi:hypothetical protein
MTWVALGRQRHERHTRIMPKALRSKIGVGILRRGDRCGGENNVGKVVSYANDPLSFALVTRKEFKKVLELARVLVLKESLRAAGFAWVPAELRSSSVVFGLLADNEGIPSFMD